jgi:hypothetical protein
MILGELFGALRAQLNKIANLFFEADPIAVMRLDGISRGQRTSSILAMTSPSRMPSTTSIPSITSANTV